MMARYASKLPDWLILYPFEVLVAILTIVQGWGFLLSYYAGARPLLGVLHPLTAGGLGGLTIIAGLLLMLATCHRDVLEIVGTLYTVVLLMVIHLVILAWNGVQPHELAPPFMQGVCLAVLGVLRASYLRSAWLAAKRVTKE